MTQEDKPIAIILPNWNPNEPRFIIEDAHDELADDRAFKNGKCVYNQRLGIVYTVEYIVDALNELGNEIDKLKKENEQLKKEIKQYWKCRDKWKQEAKELKEENEQLRQQLKEKQEDEKLYAQEILELNKTKKEMLNFKQLGSDY